jgi:hypothetical protein
MNMTLVVNLPDNKGRTTTFAGDFSSAGFEGSVNSLFNMIDLEKDIDRMGNIAIGKALAKVNPASLMTGEYVADFEKTVTMLRRPFKGATDLVNRIRKARKRNLKKSGSNLAQANASAWLEYSYGWAPLLLDGETIIDAALQNREFGGEVRVSRSEVKQFAKETKSFSFGGLTNPIWNRSGTASRSQTARACAGVMYGLKNRTTSGELLKFLGLRLRDVPSTAWEIIPYSFVVDWFANVGDLIRAMTPDPDIVYHGRWVTSLVKTETQVENCLFSYSEQGLNGNWVGTSAAMNNAHWTNEYVQRDTDPVIPAYPVLTFNPMSIPHTLSAMSLATQQIARAVKDFRH